MLLLRYLLILIPAALSADTFTANTFAPGDSCSNVGATPNSCQSVFGTLRASGTANAITRLASPVAGFGFALPGSTGLMFSAEANVMARCIGINDCMSVSGDADVEMDLAIHGMPAGTPGIIEIAISVYRIGDVSPLNVKAKVGLPFNPNLAPHPGGFVLYNFLYDQPFHVSAMAAAGCSECGSFGFPPSPIGA